MQIVILGLCFAMMAGLALLVYRTRLGTAMRATAQNPQVAGLMGIESIGHRDQFYRAFRAQRL